MNNLLFIALIIALLYYFLIYLPQQKQLPIKTHSQSTQTDPYPPENPELENALDTLIKDIQELNKSL